MKNITTHARIYALSDRFGLVARSSAVTHGVSAQAWSRANRRDVVDIVHSGVSGLPGSRPSEFRRIAAAVLSVGDGALASHRSAALLWGVPKTEDRCVDVIVQNRRRRATRSGVVIHRPTDLADLTPSWRDGIPCTNPLRLLVDLGAVAPGLVTVALDHFLVEGLVTPQACLAALERHARRGRTGIGAFRRALESSGWTGGQPDSVLEVRFVRFVKRHGLPDFAAHERISGYEVDFANHALKLAIELDGWVFHGDREAFERDRQRDLVLAAAGWLVVRVTWRRLHDEPAALATSLRKVIAGRT